MRRCCANPSYKEFLDYVRLGEQVTWPMIPMIRDRTRLSRSFGMAIGLLIQRIESRAAGKEAAPSRTHGRKRARPVAR